MVQDLGTIQTHRYNSKTDWNEWDHVFFWASKNRMTRSWNIETKPGWESQGFLVLRGFQAFSSTEALSTHESHTHLYQSEEPFITFISQLFNVCPPVDAWTITVLLWYGMSDFTKSIPTEYRHQQRRKEEELLVCQVSWGRKQWSNTINVGSIA